MTMIRGYVALPLGDFDEPLAVFDIWNKYFEPSLARRICVGVVTDRIVAGKSFSMAADCCPQSCPQQQPRNTERPVEIIAY